MNLLLESRQESLAQLNADLARLKQDLDSRTAEKIQVRSLYILQKSIGTVFSSLQVVVELEEERGGKARAEFLERRLSEQRAVLEVCG